MGHGGPVTTGTGSQRICLGRGSICYRPHARCDAVRVSHAGAQRVAVWCTQRVASDLIVMVKHEDRRGCQQPGPGAIFSKQRPRTLLGLVALANCRAGAGQKQQPRPGRSDDFCNGEGQRSRKPEKCCFPAKCGVEFRWSLLSLGGVCCGRETTIRWLLKGIVRIGGSKLFGLRHAIVNPGWGRVLSNIAVKVLSVRTRDVSLCGRWILVLYGMPGPCQICKDR